MSILTARYRRSSRPEPTVMTATAPTGEPALMRFLTVGGATVELRTHRFETHYDALKGRPYVTDKRRTVDGFAWKCLGCDTASTDGWQYRDGYLPDEKSEAREHANAHASECRAMPKPDGA